jgi:hypothetical protein
MWAPNDNLCTRWNQLKRLPTLADPNLHGDGLRRQLLDLYANIYLDLRRDATDVHLLPTGQRPWLQPNGGSGPWQCHGDRCLRNANNYLCPWQHHLERLPALADENLHSDGRMWKLGDLYANIYLDIRRVAADVHLLPTGQRPRLQPNGGSGPWQCDGDRCLWHANNYFCPWQYHLERLPALADENLHGDGRMWKLGDLCAGVHLDR